MRYKKSFIGLSVAACLVLAALIAVIVYAAKTGSEKSAAQQATSDEAPQEQITPTQAPQTATETPVPATEAPTEAPAVLLDEELAALLEKGGITPEDFAGYDTTQVVTVSSSGTNARIDLWQLRDGKWMKDNSMSAEGYVGDEGVTKDMSEFVSATPGGFFPIKEAFYLYEKPETGLDLFEITYNTYWVDDPESKSYNLRVEGDDNADWSSAVRMVDNDDNAYGFVIGYNLSRVKNKGSATFFRIGYGPSAGCVSTDESTVLAYLKALSKEQNPYILIV